MIFELIEVSNKGKHLLRISERKIGRIIYIRNNNPPLLRRHVLLEKHLLLFLVLDLLALLFICQSLDSSLQPLLLHVLSKFALMGPTEECPVAQAVLLLVYDILLFLVELEDRRVGSVWCLYKL